MAYHLYPDWVKHFITYDKHTHLFTVWDETQTNIIEQGIPSWDIAAEKVMQYSNIVKNIYKEHKGSYNKCDYQKCTKWDKRYVDMAMLVASWSKDPSTKVGAVIVDNKHRVVSLGFNGYPHGVKDIGLDNREEKYEKIIHAEINSIMFAQTKLVGCTIYVYPLLPCARCMSVIVQSGITRVVAAINYNDNQEVQKRWMATNKLAISMANEVSITIDVVQVVNTENEYNYVNE